MISAILRYWRRLRGSESESDEPEDEHEDSGRDRSGFRRGSTTYEPREGEDVLADVTVKGRDESRGIDLGAGALIVSTKAVVFVTTRKKWRIPVRNIAHGRIGDDGAFAVETKGEKRFSFVTQTTGDKKELAAAVDDLFGDDEDE